MRIVFDCECGRRHERQMYKRCAGRCGRYLLAAVAFAEDSRSADGLQSYCRSCKRGDDEDPVGPYAFPSPQQALDLRTGHAGWVYFVQRTDEPGKVKIGGTGADDVDERVAALQTAVPAPLLVCGKIPGSKASERTLHARFAAARITGGGSEWFLVTDEIRSVCPGDLL